eukprot:m51a1_g820 hypothetical protein (673) ;mRNA; r:699604-701622
MSLALRVVRKMSDIVGFHGRKGRRSHSVSPTPSRNRRASDVSPCSGSSSPATSVSPEPGQKRRLAGLVLDRIELGPNERDFLATNDCNEAFFVNCTGSVSDAAITAAGGTVVRIETSDLPIKPLREGMYTTDELRSIDEAAYQWSKKGRLTSNRGRIAAYLHDGCLLDALMRHVEGHTVVGIMGGHAMKRADASYAQVTWLCWELAKRGFMVASGGGPGAMEAANLGAFLVNHDRGDVCDALRMLAAAGNNGHEFEYQNTETAEAVLAKYGRPGDGALSVGVPTWVYGHEPFNRFCGRCAKFISNAVREDILIAICNGGIVFSPGAGGTRTEIYQFGVPNSYAKETPESYSKPAIFLGAFWLHCGIFSAYLNLAQREDADRSRPNGYSRQAYCLEHNEDIIQVLEEFRSSQHGAPPPPVPPPDTRVLAAAEVAVAEAISTGKLGNNSTVGICSGEASRLALRFLGREAKDRGWKLSCVPSSDMSFAAITQAGKNFGGAIINTSFLAVTETDVAFCEASAVDNELTVIPSSADVEGCIPTERMLLTSTKHVIAVTQPGVRRSASIRGSEVVVDILPLGLDRVKASILKLVPGAKMTQKLLSRVSLATPHVTDAGNVELALDAGQLLDAFGGETQRVLHELRAIPGVVDVGVFSGLVSTVVLCDTNEILRAECV